MARSRARYRYPVPFGLLGAIVAFMLAFGPVATRASLQATPIVTPDASPVVEADAPVVLFAADGMRPDLVEQYAGAGAMPTIIGLIANGVRGDNGLLQAFPPNTGTG